MGAGNINRCFVLAISIALMASLLGGSHAQTAGDFRSFCQRTSFANICIQTIDGFGSNPKLKVNAQGWLQILKIRLDTITTSARIRYSGALTQNPGADLKRRLSNCNDLITVAVPVINNLDFEALTHSNYVEYNNQLGMALIDVEDCIAEFNNPTPVQNPVGILTQTVEDGIKLSLEGLNLFQCNKRTACR